MMTTNVNVTIPNSLYKDAKKAVVQEGYDSFSVLVEKALRKILQPRITENGFTPEFEEMVLKSEQEPEENDIVLETNEEIHNYFQNLTIPDRYKRKRQNGQNKH